MQARAVKGYPLSIHQEHLWQQGSQGLWRVVLRLQGEGVLPLERLEAALQRVLERHTILRTVFEEVPGLQLPVQVVLPEQQAVVWVQQIDLTGLPVAAQQQRITALQQQERQSPPSGTREPLLRLLLLRLQPAHWVLLMSLPSVCGDRMTLQLLLQELSAFERGETAVGEEEPLQYQEVAAWQQEMFEQPEAQEPRSYWSRVLNNQPREAHLPFALEDRAAESRADALAASGWREEQQV